MCFIIVLSKASKEPLQTAKRLVWQLTAAPELCVNLKIFYLEFFFVFFFCSCQLVLRLYYDRTEPQPVCAFRSKRPSVSDTAVLLLKSCTWLVK